MKSLILGIGNPIRGDDGVGIEVVNRLRQNGLSSEIDIKETSEAGFNILFLILGYDRVIIVDSIQSQKNTEKEIFCFSHRQIKLSHRLRLLHHTGIPTALAWAKRLKIPLPEEITFFLIKIGKGDSFAEGLSKEIIDVVPKTVDLVKKEVEKWQCRV